MYCGAPRRLLAMLVRKLLIVMQAEITVNQQQVSQMQIPQSNRTGRGNPHALC
jgi:hypothetical protein